MLTRNISESKFDANIHTHLPHDAKPLFRGIWEFLPRKISHHTHYKSSFPTPSCNSVLVDASFGSFSRSTKSVHFVSFNSIMKAFIYHLLSCQTLHTARNIYPALNNMIKFSPGSLSPTLSNNHSSRIILRFEAFQPTFKCYTTVI